MNKTDLIAFRDDIEATYKTGVIRGPIHLRDGNEQVLIDLFQKLSIGPKDYVFSTWANHFHALLKGVPASKVKARILEGESMAMNFPEHHFFTSAIVGGILPIATGVAAGLVRKFSDSRVFCFIGDMAFQTGIAHESIMYSISNTLPITFIIEDNGKSVGTPTEAAWGKDNVEELTKFYQGLCRQQRMVNGTSIEYYKYELSGPHSGVGEFISF
jgi:TPP-dependent pyruvate/acetoin dehydrogenase alpha subunit